MITTSVLAPIPGVDPGTPGLTVRCSAVELDRNCIALSTAWKLCSLNSATSHSHPPGHPCCASAYQRSPTWADKPVGMTVMVRSQGRRGLVGTVGFEPTTTRTQTVCSTRLSYAPITRALYLSDGGADFLHGSPEAGLSPVLPATQHRSASRKNEPPNRRSL